MMDAKISDLVTPCFLVDKQRVAKNCERMRATCDRLGVQLRHMTKTHKTVEGAVIATNGSKQCLACSTVVECEMFASAGFDDILLTRIFTTDRIPRMQKLLTQLNRFHVMVDNDCGINTLVENHDMDKPWSVFLKVDTGCGRAGALWDSPDVVRLAKRLVECTCLDFQGIYAHDGHSYAKLKTQVTDISTEGVTRLTYVVERLRDEGITCTTVGVGSTPTASQPVESMNRLTELHPGNFIFMDYQQYTLGSCDLTDIAPKVATRVTGHYPHRNQMLIDAGFLATSLDGARKLPHGASYGVFENASDLKLVGVNQETGFVEPVQGTLDYSKYPVGSMLFIYPWHACDTAAMFGRYHVCEGDRVIEQWTNCHYW